MSREQRLTHVDEAGAARMVDVSGKDVTVRTATATGRVLVSPEVVALLRDGAVPKGDALAVARIAGIQAAKRTPDLVPLCHPIAIHAVDVELAVAELTLVDMVKAVDRAATITDVRVEHKSGGRSGDWRRGSGSPVEPSAAP
jgi:cyclic pyranopterin phosphate synthase